MTPYVAGVVKRLTRRIVAPLCVGSSPTTRPIFFYLKTGIPGEIGTGSLIWGYRQAVRQRTLTPLSVVRLHLPLPVIKSCRQPSAGFFAWAGRTAARLSLIAYHYPLSVYRLTVILHRSGEESECFPSASLADKSRSALFYNAPVRAPPKPSESSGQRPVHLKNLFTQPFCAACGEAADPAPEGR